MDASGEGEAVEGATPMTVDPTHRADKAAGLAPRGNGTHTADAAPRPEAHEPREGSSAAGTATTTERRAKRKVVEKKKRTDEIAKLKLALWPTQALLSTFETATGSSFNGDLLLDDVKFRDKWKEFNSSANPTGKARSTLRELAKQLHINRRIRVTQRRDGGESGKPNSVYGKRDRHNTSTHSTPTGKPPQKIAKVSAKAPEEEETVATNVVVEDSGDAEEYPPLANFHEDGGSYAAAAQPKTREESALTLYIHQSRDDRLTMPHAVWKVFLEKFQLKVGEHIVTTGQCPLFEFIGFNNGIGCIVPEDEESQALAREIVGSITVNENHFRAWVKGERGKYSLLTLNIPESLPEQDWSAGKLLTLLAIQNKLDQEDDNVKVQSCKRVPDRKIRCLKFLVGEANFVQLAKANGNVRLAACKLVVHFKGKPLTEEAL